MKTLIVEKTKKFDHIIGAEYKEEYVARDKNDVQIYIGSELAMLDGEQYEANEDEINSINDLEDGNYTIDLGDFYLNVEIKDAE